MSDGRSLKPRRPRIGRVRRTDLVRLFLLRQWSMVALARLAGVSYVRIRYVLVEQEKLPVGLIFLQEYLPRRRHGHQLAALNLRQLRAAARRAA